MAPMNEEGFLRALQALLPPGRAWTTMVGRTLTNLLSAFSVELARIEGRAVNLIEEADPRTTFEMLSDWEAALGLPDPCIVVDQTVAQRRLQVLTKYSAQGGQSPAYFIGLASLLGFAVTITEFDEWSVDSDVDTALCGPDWASAWQVNAPLETVREWDVTDDVETPLASWGNQALECVLKRYKPAHTVLIFAYS